MIMGAAESSRTAGKPCPDKPNGTRSNKISRRLPRIQLCQSCLTVIWSTGTLPFLLAVSSPFSGRRVQPSVDTIHVNNDQSSTLSATQDVILSKLMLVKIRMPDAENLIAEVI